MSREDFLRQEQQREAALRAQLHEYAFPVPRIELPEMTMAEIKLPDIRNYNMADTLYEHIEQHISETNAKLGKDQQILLLFINQAGQEIRVTDIGYHNPNMIKIYGTDHHGNDCCVLIHMNSLQLQITIIKGDKEKNSIGFLNEQKPQVKPS